MNTALNILMITHKQKFETAPRSMAMAQQLVQRGHHVSMLVISPDKKMGMKEYDASGIHIIESPDLFKGRLRSGWDPWNALNRIIFLSKSKTRYDLIHCFETRPVTIYPALYLRRKLGIPMITDWNDWWGHHGLIDVNRPAWYHWAPFGVIETYYEETFRKRAEGLTVIATALAERAVKMGMDRRKIAHISGGAMTDRVPVRSMAESRARFNLPLDGTFIGFGSANSHLDMEIIMASMVIVREKYPEVKLIITGKAKPEIYDMVRQHDLEKNVLFTGFVSFDDYFYYLSCSNLCILPMADQPYNWGRWPNKMGDYLCAARPTVSNPVGDIKLLFDKHKVGLLSEYNAEDFAQQILYFLDHPDIAEEYGNTARQVAESEYNWQTLTEKLELFYFKICAEKAFQIHNKNTAFQSSDEKYPN